MRDNLIGGDRGLLLIDVLWATLLLAIVLGGLVPLLATGQQTWDTTRRGEEMVHNARFALDQLDNIIRASQSFQTISPTDIKLTYFFGDGTTIPTAEWILNTVTNELQYRWNLDPPQPAAGPFRSMSVVCFDATNTTIACTTVGSVRSVQISLVAMDPDGVLPDITVTSRAFVQYP